MSRVFLCASLLAVTLIGCNRNTNAPTFPVSGTVTLDGKPVEGAAVSFISLDPKNRPAAASTDKDGKYSLTTFVANDGAMAGDYQVSVTKFWSEAGKSPYDKTPDEESAAAPAAAPAAQTDEEMRAAYEKAYKSAPKGPPKGAPQIPKSGNHLPKKYEIAGTSGLTYSVKGSGTFDIPLVSK